MRKWLGPDDDGAAAMPADADYRAMIRARLRGSTPVMPIERVAPDRRGKRPARPAAPWPGPRPTPAPPPQRPATRTPSPSTQSRQSPDRKRRSPTSKPVWSVRPVPRSRPWPIDRAVAERGVTLLSARLKRLREEADYTHGDMAHLCGCSRNAYTKWEMGIRTPHARELIMLAIALETTIDALVSPVPDDEQPAWWERVASND